MSKKIFTKKERAYQNSKKYSFRQIELAFEHSLKIIEEKEKDIKELRADIHKYEKIFKNQKKEA